MKTRNPKRKRESANGRCLQQLVRPFVDWGDRYFGLSVQDGKATTKPDESKDWTEYHLEYRGGDIWEIEVAPTENTAWTVWRGKIPNRETFVTIMQNIEDAPPIEWPNEKSKPRRTQTSDTRHNECHS